MTAQSADNLYKELKCTHNAGIWEKISCINKRNTVNQGTAKLNGGLTGYNVQGVVKDQDYYYFVNKSIKGGLPTLWYPPEFFLKSKYDKYCDVWSYGVTMFEMWSYGEVSFVNFFLMVEIHSFSC